MRKFISFTFTFCLFGSVIAQDVTIDGVTITVNTGTTVTLGSALTNKSNGGLVDLNGTAVLTVGTTLTNNSATTTLFPTDAGDVQLLGAAGQSVAGTNSITFYDLTLNNTHADGVTLSTAISVANNLTFTDGDIDMNSNNIDLGTAGTLVGEANDKRIYGTSGVVLASDRNITTTGEVAGLGLNFSALAGGTIADLDIQRGHAEQTGLGGATSVLRYFDLDDNGEASGYSVDMRIEFFDGELNSKTEANLLVDRSTDAGSTWTAWAGSSVNTASNYAEAPSVTDFSRWTLSSSNALALPVELLSFEVNYDGTNGALVWETASETNNDFFNVEKSIDGQNWVEIGAVPGAGTSSIINRYTFTDYNVEQGVTYYRLKQTDFNGDYNYSQPKFVQWNQKNLPAVFAFNGNLTVDKFGSDYQDQDVQIELVDNLGRVILNNKMYDSRQTFLTTHLSVGVYFVNIRDQSSRMISTSKVVLQ